MSSSSKGLRFRPGQLARTCNSTAPLLNNGLLVVVLRVDPSMLCHGRSTPYLIRRVDGEVFASTYCAKTGAPQWYAFHQVWAEPHKLQPIGEAQPTRRATRLAMSGISPATQGKSASTV